MLKRIRAARGNENGFTLTELLITIVILGVLAGIVVFAVAQFTDDGDLVACQTDKRNVDTASAAYRAKNPDFAPDMEALVTAQYLQAIPEAETYTISYDDETGIATCSLDT